MTYEALPGCRGPKGDPCADGTMDLFPLTPLYVFGWAVVASLLVYLAFKLWQWWRSSSSAHGEVTGDPP